MKYLQFKLSVKQKNKEQIKYARRIDINSE